MVDLGSWERRLGGLLGTVGTNRDYVEPTHLAAAVRDEVARVSVHDRDGKRVAANDVVVELGSDDYERLHPYEAQIVGELRAMLDADVIRNGWGLDGAVMVGLEHEPALKPGAFRVRAHVSTDSRVHENLDHRGGPSAQQLPAVVAAAADPGIFRRNPRLVLSTGGSAHAGTPAANGVQRALALLSAVTIIGRSETADITVQDPGVSPEHAMVELRGDEAWISDLGSLNGTTLDGHAVSSPIVMTSGQRIGIGSLVFIYLRDPEQS